jgi:hypothetical protein
MSEQKFYRILQEFTDGWDLVAPRLTKEQSDELLNTLLNTGVNPDHLKVVDEPNPEEPNDDRAYRPFIPKESSTEDIPIQGTWPPPTPVEE